MDIDGLWSEYDLKDVCDKIIVRGENVLKVTSENWTISKVLCPPVKPTEEFVVVVSHKAVDSDCKSQN